jgi:hypothetical protein
MLLNKFLNFWHQRSVANNPEFKLLVLLTDIVDSLERIDQPLLFDKATSKQDDGPVTLGRLTKTKFHLADFDGNTLYLYFVGGTPQVNQPLPHMVPLDQKESTLLKELLPMAGPSGVVG